MLVLQVKKHSHDKKDAQGCKQVCIKAGCEPKGVLFQSLQS